MNLFITGTDTDVGKTYVTSVIVRALAQRGDRVMPFKPIACGTREDAAQLLEASGRTDITVDDVNPVWFKSRAAPFAASLIEGGSIDVVEARGTGQGSGETKRSPDCRGRGRLGSSRDRGSGDVGLRRPSGLSRLDRQWTTSSVR